MAYQLVQTFYWLGLSVWFGGAVFVSVAAAAVFRAMREEEPVLPQVLAVNLEGQHGTLLGSIVMKHLLGSLGRIEAGCAGVVVVCAGLQFLVANVSGPNLGAGVVRVVLAAVAAGVLGYDRWVVMKRAAGFRETYLAHADEPEVANPAKEGFDAAQRVSLNLLLVMVCLLAGLVLFSAAITPVGESRVVSAGR